MSRLVAWKAVYIKPEYVYELDGMLANVIEAMQKEYPDCDIDVDAEWETETVDDYEEEK